MQQRAKSLLLHWLNQHGRKLTRKQRWRIHHAAKTLTIVRTDNKLYDGWALIGRPTVIHLAPEPNMPLPALLVHEVAHIIAWIAYRDPAHGRAFQRAEQQLTPAGSPQVASQPILPPAGSLCTCAARAVSVGAAAQAN